MTARPLAPRIARSARPPARRRARTGRVGAAPAASGACLSRPVVAALRAFAREPGVAWVAVFGSRARGDHRPDSDLDVAVGLLEPPAAAARGAVGDRLAVACRVPGLEVDLVLVDGASPLLRHRVASDGLLIAARDPLDWPRFREAAIREYLDEWPTIRFHQQALRERIRDGSFGR